MIKTALVSVSDKTGLDKIIALLAQKNIEIISTGGTRKYIENLGARVTPIENITGNPEAFDGRMKTISFQVESGLLYKRDNETHINQARELNIPKIDLVICNLYPFDKCVENQEQDFETLIDNVDIGGPTMIRAAAKNMAAVTVLTNPDQYDEFCESLTNKGEIDFDLRKNFALDALRLTAQYDLMISEYLTENFSERSPKPHFLYSNIQELRYGENSHQKASLYLTSEDGIAHAKQLHGKALSYNNYLDAEAAWKSAGDAYLSSDDESKTAISVIKHLNPCGLALGSSPRETLELAWNGDPISAFGSIICTTSTVDEDFANFLSDKFIEVIIAPEYSMKSLSILRAKKNLRILTQVRYIPSNEITMRSISGGMLVQDEDEHMDPEFQLMTENEKVSEDIGLCRFGVMACKHLKSNAIALVGRDGNSFHLVGAGMGQPNRIDSLKELALPRAKQKGANIENLVMISDAFFPFADTIEVCNEVGIHKIIQPGGSIKDKEVIAACDKYNISMAFTGRRHFRH